jgi:hypothetical protein
MNSYVLLNRLIVNRLINIKEVKNMITYFVKQMKKFFLHEKKCLNYK